MVEIIGVIIIYSAIIVLGIMAYLSRNKGKTNVS
jgi:hypothetical protein